MRETGSDCVFSFQGVVGLRIGLKLYRDGRTPIPEFAVAFPGRLDPECPPSNGSFKAVQAIEADLAKIAGKISNLITPC